MEGEDHGKLKLILEHVSYLDLASYLASQPRPAGGQAGLPHFAHSPPKITERIGVTCS